MISQIRSTESHLTQQGACKKAREFFPTNFNMLDKTGILEMHAFTTPWGAPTKLQCPTTTAIKTTAFAISKEASRFVISFTIVLAQTRINHSKNYFRFRIGGFIIMTAFSRIRHPENPRQRQQQRRSVYRSPHAGVAAREIASKETLGSSLLWYGRRCRVP